MKAVLARAAAGMALLLAGGVLGLLGAGGGRWWMLALGVALIASGVGLLGWSVAARNHRLHPDGR